MVDNPLFSVLIANYNNGKYLMGAIESVRNQTYTNWEIVLVDDGSTDNSHELYKQLEQDSRIHIFYNEGNKGCGYTKRRCAEMANGKISGFLDADDVLLPEAIMSHIETHIQHPEVSCVFSRYYFCDENLNVLKELRLLEINEGCSYFTNRDYMPEHLASFKKVCYEKTSGIAPELKAGVDQDLYFKLEEVAPVYVLNSFTYMYRRTDNQISQGDNHYKAFYWNLIVRHATCKRRQLNPEKYSCQDFVEFVAPLNVKMNRLEDELFRIRSSHAYRVGKALLRTISWYKNKK